MHLADNRLSCHLPRATGAVGPLCVGCHTCFTKWPVCVVGLETPARDCPLSPQPSYLPQGAQVALSSLRMDEGYL